MLNEAIRRKYEGEPVPTERLTLGDYLVDRWLPIQKARVRPTTYDGYRRSIDLHVHPDGNRKAYVRNGTPGTVTALHEDALTVDFDGIGTIRVPRPFIDSPSPGLDHAYALTSSAVQGSTHPVSTSRIDSTATRAEAYVDITRGRKANHLYLTPPPEPAYGEQFPQTDVRSREHRRRFLDEPHPEPTAFELMHPSAQRRAPSSAAMPSLP